MVSTLQDCSDHAYQIDLVGRGKEKGSELIVHFGNGEGSKFGILTQIVICCGIFIEGEVVGLVL